AVHLAGDGLHRLEVARRRDRKTRLDHVDAEILERVRDLQLLGQVHAGPRRLLAVPQRGVEDDQAVTTHGWIPSLSSVYVSRAIAKRKRKTETTKKPRNHRGPRVGISEHPAVAADGGPRTNPP